VSYTFLITHTGGSRAVGRVISDVCDFVCLCVCVCIRALKAKWLELSTPNLVHKTTDILYGSGSACIDTEVKGQGHMVLKTVTVAWLLEMYAAVAVCCCCWCGTARRM